MSGELEIELATVEKTLQAIDKEKRPLEWAKYMNIKGVVLMNLENFKSSEDVFNKAIPLADDKLKFKIFINYSKLNYFIKQLNRATMLLDRVFDLYKSNKRPRYELFLGYAHMLKGQIFYAMSSDRKLTHEKRKMNEKKALNEFKKSEYFFEGNVDLKGVGLACMEIARIHIKNKNLTTAWNYLKKSENCMSKFGSEEKLGVAVCKGVALYYSGKEEEAQEVLKRAYDERDEFGRGRYMLYEILDAYLDTRSRMVQYQKALM